GMLYNMIHTLYRKEGSSLLDLVRFIDDEQNSDLVQLGMQTDNYVIKDYFAHKFMDTKMSVTKHGLANRLNNFLAAQSLQRLIIGKTTIDLSFEINQKNLIVFNLSKGKLGTKVATIYGRFIITTILNLALARADIEEKRRVHFHVYVDEFQNFLSDTFIEVFAEGRKYKTFLTVATQVVGLGMSSDMKKAVLGNANVKIVGNAGYSSREEMIKQMSYIETEKMKKKGIRKRSFAKLKVGRFIVQYGIKNVFKIKVPKFLLGNKHAMKAKYWEAIRARLKRTKYVPPFYHQTTKKKMPYPKYPRGKRSGLLRQNSASPRDFRSQLQP
ncbi:MAG: type IV secretory system conjugative DNA transfer family protein, partial [Bacteroidota bacterium]